MTSVEDAAYAQLGTLIGVVVAEVESLRAGVAAKDQALADASALIESLRGQLADAQADQAAQVQAAVDQALALDSQADAARVTGYTDQLRAALPAVEVPDVPVPDPGVPAAVPDGSTVEVPKVSTMSDTGWATPMA